MPPHASPTNHPLKCVSGKEMTIPAQSGKERIADASDVFFYIDPDFQSLSDENEAVSTEETRIRMYETCENAKFTQIFASLSRDLDTLCFTQHQIKSIVQRHKNELGKAKKLSIFLFRDCDQYFVAMLLIDLNEVANIGVDPFGTKRLQTPLQVIVPSHIG